MYDHYKENIKVMLDSKDKDIFIRDKEGFIALVDRIAFLIEEFEQKSDSTIGVRIQLDKNKFISWNGEGFN